MKYQTCAFAMLFLFFFAASSAHAFAPCESAFNCGAYKGKINLNESSSWEETLTLSSSAEDQLDLLFNDEGKMTSWSFLFSKSEQDFPRTFSLQLHPSEETIGSGRCEGEDHCKYTRVENGDEIQGSMTFDKKAGTMFRVEYKSDGSYYLRSERMSL